MHTIMVLTQTVCCLIIRHRVGGVVSTVECLFVHAVSAFIFRDEGIKHIIVDRCTLRHLPRTVRTLDIQDLRHGFDYAKGRVATVVANQHSRNPPANFGPLISNLSRMLLVLINSFPRN